MCRLSNVITAVCFHLNSDVLRFSLESEGKEGEGGGREGERRDGGGETEGESEGVMDGAERKQAVLNVAFRYLDTYRELLQEEGERSNSFPKVTHATVSGKKQKSSDLKVVLITLCHSFSPLPPCSGTCTDFQELSLKNMAIARFNFRIRGTHLKRGF